MKTTGSKTGLVLQGYFCRERFRGKANRATVAQPKGAARPMSNALRPELLPANMRGGVAQAKPERGQGGERGAGYRGRGCCQEWGPRRWANRGASCRRG